MPPAHSIVEGVAVPPGAGAVVVAPQGVAPAVVAKIGAAPVKVFSNTTKFTNGQTAKLTAVPAPGYKFVGWSEVGIPLTNSTNYSLVNVRANHNLIAQFTNIPIPPVAQTITFPGIPAQKVTNGSVTLKATSSSKVPVSYSVTSTPTNIASVSSNVVTFTGAGIVKVTAMQAGNASFKPAKPVVRLFSITKSAQTITFSTIPKTSLMDGVVTFGASASSGPTNNISFKMLTPRIATLVGHTVSLKAIGWVMIQATQAGNNAYTPTTRTLKFLITK